MTRISWVLIAASIVLGLWIALDAQEPVTKNLIEKLGYPPSAKLLIIHGDDMGVAHSVDMATEKALREGWITSASIMVPCSWFPEVAAFAREHPELDLGLHLTLTSEWKLYRWRPLEAGLVPSLIDKDGYLAASEDLAAAAAKPSEVDREIRAQIERARSAGVQFTHFDSHMTTLFQTPTLFDIYQTVGSEYRVPIFIAKKYFGQAGNGYNIGRNEIVVTDEFQMHPGIRQQDWEATYEKWLTGLGPGLYQLTVHLGYNNDELRAITSRKTNWWDAPWRQADFDTLSSPKFRNFLKQERFTLVSWHQISKGIN